MHACNDIKQSRKRGFGIMEVMVAALVLGLLYAAVCQLQKGNRESLLRIRGRDGATEVAQNIIDELSARGVAYFTDDNMTPCGENCLAMAVPSVTRTWKGQPGIGSYDISITYDISIRVSSDTEDKYRAQESTLLSKNTAESLSHVYAKRLDVTVSWPYKGSTQSITVSGVIR